MPSSRRDFIESSASLFSGAWLALNLPVLEQLGRDAHDALGLRLPFETLTAAEARTMAAFAEQIIPTTDTPGAKEAGAIYFIDRALGGVLKNELATVRAGLKDLDARARKDGAKSFADLTAKKQIDLIKKIERTPFFNVARTLTVFGTFADPKHGGGRDQVGFRIVGMEHQAVYQPPFGYYDAQVSK